MEVQTFQMAENIEKHLTVNVILCFMSAIACLPLLRKTAKDFDIQTTLTFCGSMYHIFGPDDEFDAGLSEDADMFDALSDSTRTDIIWRYALSKLMVHQCFHELVAHVDQDVEHTDPRVIINIVNPGWCGTELSRAKPSNLGEKLCFAVMGWTAEKAVGFTSMHWQLGRAVVDSTCPMVALRLIRSMCEAIGAGGFKRRCGRTW